jgi:hypothetical protein
VGVWSGVAEFCGDFVVVCIAPVPRTHDELSRVIC